MTISMITGRKEKTAPQQTCASSLSLSASDSASLSSSAGIEMATAADAPAAPAAAPAARLFVPWRVRPPLAPGGGNERGGPRAVGDPRPFGAIVQVSQPPTSGFLKLEYAGSPKRRGRDEEQQQQLSKLFSPEFACIDR